MQLSENQMAKIRQATSNWINFASERYGKKLDVIDVRFDLRGRTSGMFCHRGRESFIRYNSAIFCRYFDENLTQTVPHEVAHYVVFKLHPRYAKPHGPEWKQVMHDFGAPADVTSKLDIQDLSTRRLKRYRYRCDCREHELTSIRHNRIERGVRRYGCPKCHQPLVRDATI